MATINLESYDLAPSVREDLECIAQHDGVITEEDVETEFQREACLMFIDRQVEEHYELRFNEPAITMPALQVFCTVKEYEKQIADSSGDFDVPERAIVEYRVDPILREGILLLPEPGGSLKVGQAILDDGRAYDLYYTRYSEDGFPLVYDETTKMYRLTDLDLKNHPNVWAFIPSTKIFRDEWIPSAELTEYIRLQDQFRHQAVIQRQALSKWLMETDDFQELQKRNLDRWLLDDYGQLYSIVEERDSLLRDVYARNADYAAYLCEEAHWWSRSRGPRWTANTILPYGLHKPIPTPVMEHVANNAEMQKLQEAFKTTCVRERDVTSREVPDDALFRIALVAAGMMVATLPEKRQEELFTQWSSQCVFDPDQVSSGEATIEFLLSDTVRGESQNYFRDYQDQSEGSQSLRWQCFMDSGRHFVDACGKQYSIEELPTGDGFKKYVETTPYESCVPPLPVVQGHYHIEGVKRFLYGLFESIIPEKYKPQGPNDDYMSCLDGIIRE